ncbi:hypothetical protein [Listeria innocua]|uniref:hypothetical protein n=1 Tax=Listeria innocua TaxID=1642 RepID=UPI00164DBF17|nr:hypothetical protein [Listeria innocua]
MKNINIMFGVKKFSVLLSNTIRFRTARTIYKNPNSYIVLKLSLNNGFILLVESNKLFYQERKLFKNLSEIDHEISSLFGTAQQLQPIAIETLNNLEYYA